MARLVLAFAGVVLVGCNSTAYVPGSIDWNRYYDTPETDAIMMAYEQRYPELARVFSIGQSYLGADLLVIEVSNQRNKPAAHKPALYVDGGIHSGELTGAAVTLVLMDHLLRGYGEDPEVTALLDSHVFYIRPKFNPDGADLTLNQGVSLRSSVRPWDDDRDGLRDEDPPNDLNGDGIISDMRIPDANGNMVISAADPRLMVRKTEADGDKQSYRVVREGVDDDGDGSLNEDGVGGLDLNRNFPRNWALPFRQLGAGPFPLSEPETHATVRFLDAHPNVTSIIHGHTSGGFVYRLPSASDPSKFDQDDLALVKHLGAEYTRTTERPVRPSSTHAIDHRYGTLISWGYWDRGIVGWVPEYWPGLASDVDRTERAALQLKIIDEQFGGRYFVDWAPFEHPQYGVVEIGGLQSRFVNQNPPPEMLEAECRLQLPWILYLARQAPLVAMDEPHIERLADGGIVVTVTAHNRGMLPTNLTQRGLQARVVTPVFASIEVDGGELVVGAARQDLGHLRGSHDVPEPERPQSASARWVVRAAAPGATVVVTVASQTGGTVRSAAIALPR